jgi:hypothetical protein
MSISSANPSGNPSPILSSASFVSPQHLYSRSPFHDGLTLLRLLSSTRTSSLEAYKLVASDNTVLVDLQLNDVLLNKNKNENEDDPLNDSLKAFVDSNIDPSAVKKYNQNKYISLSCTSSTRSLCIYLISSKSPPSTPSTTLGLNYKMFSKFLQSSFKNCKIKSIESESNNSPYCHISLTYGSSLILLVADGKGLSDGYFNLIGGEEQRDRKSSLTQSIKKFLR